MADDWVAALEAQREQMGRASATDKVADALRTRIIEGDLRPGVRLSEERIGRALGVSRNTLREAFHLLGHEGLVVREFNRGVFVRSLGATDVRDLYAFRRVLETAAVRRLAERGGDLTGVRAAVDEGGRAAADGDWRALGSANMHFHAELTALAGIRRLDDAMRQVLAQMRLVFAAMDDPRTFHQPYLAHNRELVELLDAGRWAEAEESLLAYLETAESQLLTALAA
ncbi:MULTISPECIES: GntR family transcriptional regulator [Janibacter]|uniref:DNA-binding transcriptional regulator, GntR family n=1 Tax=Janibacter indicus TaxID=857417 RepID=A0A1L3MGB8_9MICO|nr:MULTISPECIES: GntR family transcriptional regulator [Janibacter]APH01389.1 GntR family transcriptional regulator [Janibacter indicus]QNF95587.1 GntR family transcriptional regulator [Janibacter sp. YB324]QOK24342.1 GntR family transcriptional regulator [Janibacter indicus]SMC79867.1 DNA-binding transcriptional regulator, GntR family [Janibacter indicus]